MTSEQRTKDLIEANNRYVKINRLLKNELIRCQKQFAYYGKEHRNKAEAFRHKASFKENPERENLLENADSSDKKADVNEDFVRSITSILNVTKPT